MSYRLLAGSCEGGPCPTFYVDDTTGDVTVQGYRTESPTLLPAGEDVVYIPADAWRRLLANLPATVLISALLRRFRRRATTTSRDLVR